MTKIKEKNETRILPKLRFPEFEGDGEWKTARIREILQESKIPSAHNNPTKRITVRLNLKGIEKRDFRGTESETTIHFIRKSGQFIYGKQNIHKGAFGIIPKELDGFETSQDLPAFDFTIGNNPQWFYYYLGRDLFYSSLEEKMTGTGSKRLKQEIFKNVQILKPSNLAEQQKIADCLSSLDELIDAEDKKLEALRLHKKGLMQELFPSEGQTLPKRRFPEFQNSPEWEKKTGNKLFDPISNKNHNSDLPILAITQEHGAIPRDKIDYRVSVTEKSIESYKVVEVGDFIISLRSFQGGIEYSNYKGLCSPAYIILRKKRDDHEGFFKHYFKTNRFIEDLNRDIEGIRDGKMVSYDQFSKIIIPIPQSKIEQQKIADFLSSIDNLITSQTKKLESLRLHKKGLMQQLFPNPDN